MNELGVLVMAYGTPATLEDVEAYYTDIRDGRPPPPDLLAELTERYRAIGGRSPLLDITMAQARGIEQRLEGPRVYVGLKHAAPFIGDAVEAMATDGIAAAVGLVLAPHYSSMSVGDYARRALRAADAAGWEGRLEMVDSWHLEPSFIELLAERVSYSLSSLAARSRSEAVVVFTAHSLPRRVLETDDPYPSQLEETASAVARRAGLGRWQVAWQSAGRTADPWLGPDILDVIRDLAVARTPAIVVCPCGFVSDHLEVLYDLDIEARKLAESLGMEFARTASFNDDPAFLDVLAGVVRVAFHEV